MTLTVIRREFNHHINGKFDLTAHKNPVPGNKNIIKEELELGQSLNLNVISIPLTYWKLPNREEIKKYFDIINNTNMRPVYLHCKHGSDRTGMLAAFYRMKMEGWTADQAYDEMRNSGFHKIRMHHFKYAIYSFRKKLEQGTL